MRDGEVSRQLSQHRADIEGVYELLDELRAAHQRELDAVYESMQRAIDNLFCTMIDVVKDANDLDARRTIRLMINVWQKKDPTWVPPLLI